MNISRRQTVGGIGVAIAEGESEVKVTETLTSVEQGIALDDQSENFIEFIGELGIKKDPKFVAAAAAAEQHQKLSKELEKLQRRAAKIRARQEELRKNLAVMQGTSNGAAMMGELAKNDGELHTLGEETIPNLEKQIEEAAEAVKAAIRSLTLDWSERTIGDRHIADYNAQTNQVADPAV